MLNTQVTFERILGTFIPGALLSFGSWYLHRSFLLKYFPNVAGDPTVSAFGSIATEARFLLFIFASLCVGLILNQCADVAIASLFRHDTMADKAVWKDRRPVRVLWSMAGFTPDQDPRTRAVESYLASPRRTQFLGMMREWAGTDESRLKSDGKINPGEAIAAHQHIVARLRVLSDASRKMIDELDFPIVFSASLLTGFVFLLPIAALSFLSSEAVDEKVKVQFNKTLIASMAFIYFCINLSSYLLKRQFKQFCPVVLTRALHFYGTANVTPTPVVEGNGHKESAHPPHKPSAVAVD